MRGGLAFIGVCLLVVAPSLPGQDAENPTASRESRLWSDLLNPLRPQKEASEKTQSSTLRSLSTELTGRAAQLRKQLLGDDSVACVRAIEELRKLGTSGAPALLESLADEQITPAIRFATLRTLGDMGKEILPAFNEQIRRGEGDWFYLTNLIRELGPQASESAPALAQALADESLDQDRRLDAAAMLIAIGPGASDVAADLVRIVEQTDDNEIRLEAARALSSMGEVSELPSDRLLTLVLDEQQDPELRATIAGVLAQQSQIPPALVPAIVGLLHPTNDSHVCCLASKAVSQLGNRGEDAAEALVVLLDHESSDVRGESATALGQLSTVAPGALEALIQHAQLEQTHYVREAIAAAIARSGRPAVDRLTSGLRSTDEEVIASTLECLAAIGSMAKSAQQPLLEMLQSEQSDRNAAVIHTLRMIQADAEGLAEKLTRMAADEHQELETRILALDTLGSRQLASDETLGVLAKLLEDLELDIELRAAAVRAMACDRVSSLPLLQRALKDDEASVRVAAAGILVRHADTRELAIPVLTAELGDDDLEEPLTQSFLALGEPAIDRLVAVAENRSLFDEQRIGAAKILGRFGGRAAAPLVELTRHEGDLGVAAQFALFDIGPREAVPQILKAIDKQIAATAGGPLSPDQRKRLDGLQQMLVDINGEMGGPSGGDGLLESAMGPASSPGSSGAAPMLEPPATSPNESSSDHAIRPRTGAKARGAEAPASERQSSPENVAPQNADLKTVKVFYGTNRQRLDTVIARRQLELRSFLPMIVFGGATMFLSAFAFAMSRSVVKASLAAIGLVITVVLAIPAFQRTIRLETDVTGRPGPVYGGQSSGALEMGTCVVTIPATHKKGKLESPSLFRLELSADPRKHIVVREVRDLDHETFVSNLRQDLAVRGSQLLVFVHGYNVNFDDAARRTAQMAVDLEFPGSPLFFSWPSQGNWHEYREDERQVELAVNPLKAFLLDVARNSNAKAIHLVAHSMGSRALTEALKEIELQSSETALFNQVVLAAPDIDARIFKDRIAPAIAAKAQRVTLYASSNDLALLASKTFSGDYRAGDTSGNILIVPGIETIDVSEVDSSLLGHSYYGSNATVLTDLKELLVSARAAKERPSLEEVPLEDATYWIFRRNGNATAAAADEQLIR